MEGMVLGSDMEGMVLNLGYDVPLSLIPMQIPTIAVGY
jgi:hypothetical protein